MRSTKKPNARQLTSTLMAIVMTATTTFQMPNIALASEAESSVAVESQIEEVTTEEASSAEVQSEVAQAAAEAETQTSTALETSGTEAGTDATQASDEVPATVAETTAEVTYEEEKTTLSAEVDPSGEDTEESEANETRGPDEELTTEIETEAQTDAASEEETEASTEEALIDLSTATKEEILSYIEAIGGDESDAFYAFIGSLGEDDYQSATSFYNGSIEAQAFTDIEYLGNGVYRIPSSRYQYCFTEQYVSDMGTLYGISFGLRIQVLYGFTLSGEITIAADVVYPDMTERFLPATLNLLAGTATVRVFNDDYDDSVDNYLVSASINRGASLPDSVGSMNDGKVLQFVVNDANAVGSLDVLIGYNATSKYSMAAEITTAELIGSASDDVNVNMAAEMYNGAYLKLDQGSVPKNLAVGDKFIYANTALTITGVETSYDLSNTEQHPDSGIHVGAKTIPTHDAQSFCFYNGKVLNLEGTNVLLSCMHACFCGKSLFLIFVDNLLPLDPQVKLHYPEFTKYLKKKKLCYTIYVWITSQGRSNPSGCDSGGSFWSR